MQATLRTMLLLVADGAVDVAAGKDGDTNVDDVDDVGGWLASGRGLALC